MEEDEFSDAYSGNFPAADANAGLNPSQDKDFKEVSLSSETSTSREIKTLKTAMLVSAVVVAVAGIAIVITKKLKEK
ncbi:hypothetical protein V6N12_030941 [Hibiscus sabdariffa]|uniref:Uncharacterized protein n=1 Tax=Hibiscus sabdariffa TaxID=183260 RepID=A0ABR2E7F8_9ROSI